MRSIAALESAIGDAAKGLAPMTLMEVCGTHTHAIRRFGLRQLLPPNIRLISGPGCPVCVTDDRDIAKALFIARQPNVTLCSFGDMLRVPSGGESLYGLCSAGADVRACVSPMDALAYAKRMPERSVVWFGVGFETTSPHSAALIEEAAASGLGNLSLLCAHKTMPNALRALMAQNRSVDGLICPGHVATITGSEAFWFVPRELKLPAAIAGFGAEDILLAILALVKMARARRPALVNAYPRAVSPGGNTVAKALVERVFKPCSARWRGLGEIEDSGLMLREEFARFDAVARFAPPEAEAGETEGCRCSEILRGLIEPTDCPHFGAACTPQSPLGACMVSSEGACAAYYREGGANP